MKKYKYFLIFLFILFRFPVFSFPLIQLTEYSLIDYPDINAKYFDFDNTGKLNISPKASDYSINDNGTTALIKGINCFPQSPLTSISAVISFDLGLDSASGKFEIGRTFAENLANLLPNNQSEFAVTSFDAFSYLEQEFTTDKSKLLNVLANLKYSEGSQWDPGFLDDLTGAIAIASQGKTNKNIVFITDGSGTIDADTIISHAKKLGIKIFIVCLTDLFNEDLKRTATGTGGQLLVLKDLKFTNSLAASVLALMMNYKPCEVIWTANPDCKEVHNIQLSNIQNKDTTELSVQIPESYQPIIVSNPAFLRFSAVLPGLNKTLDLSITAKNGAVTITELSINNPVFTIEQGGIIQPITLQKGEVRNLKVKFTPLDSALEFGSLNIKTDACSGKNILITGGFPNAQPKTATLKILEPLPHQVFIIGDTASVIWTGLLPADVVQVEYSVNNGASWDTLAKNVSGLRYNWFVPDKPSDSCLIRVIQLWPNNIGRTLDLHHKNGVNCANFNSDGSLIVTACKDSLASIWNSNNGAKLFDLKGHTKAVLWANFDRIEKYAVTSSEDKTAIIWDIVKGDSVRTLSAHTNFVRSANFSPDGKNIVTSGTEGSCFVWDVATGTIKDTVSFNAGSLWFATYSPDGKYIATANNIGLCNIWNTTTKKFDRTFDTKTNGVVPYVAFSPDGSKLAAATWIGKAVVWNFKTGDTLFTVEHYDSLHNIVPLTSANFNYTGELLLTSSINEARMWNANNGAFIPPPYAEHRSSVQTAVFNFDGTRVLTASWDSTAKIWNLLERALQTGIMDSVFSIAKSDIKSEDIEFPSVPVSSIKDSTISNFIINTSGFPIKVSSIKISGPNAKDFLIIKGFASYKLDTNKASSITIRFNPKDIGLRTALIEIVYSGNKITKVLTGIGFDPGLQVVTPTIDFKNVEVGDIRDTVISVAFRNRSDNPIRILRIRNVGPDNIHFSILSGTDTGMINPGETRQMAFRYIPELAGRKNDLIYIEHNAKGSPSRINLFGEGVLPRIDSITFSLKSIEGSPGEIVELPIYVKNISSNGISSAITGFNSSLTFNSTLLEPIEENYPGTITGSTRSITLSLPSAVVSADSIIKKIKFRVGLGNDTLSGLKLENIVPQGKGRIVIADEPSVFTLRGYCKEGGNRLFESENRLQFALLVPNPTKGSAKAEFEVIENGLHKLTLVDISGRTVLVIFERNLTPNTYSIDIITDNIPTGRYFCFLETPTKKIFRQLEISK